MSEYLVPELPPADKERAWSIPNINNYKKPIEHSKPQQPTCKPFNIKWLRCGICGQWARFGVNCKNCGAYRLVISGHIEYYNRALIRMGRAIPLPVRDTTIERVVARAERTWQDAQPVKVKRPTWAQAQLIKAIYAAGGNREQVERIIGRKLLNRGVRTR